MKHHKGEYYESYQCDVIESVGANVLKDLMPSNIALPGQVVGFSLKNLSWRDIKWGYVCSDPKNNPAVTINVFLA